MLDCDNSNNFVVNDSMNQVVGEGTESKLPNLSSSGVTVNRAEGMREMVKFDGRIFDLTKQALRIVLSILGNIPTICEP